MSRSEEYAKRKREEAKQAEQIGFWKELCRRIDAGQVIPIISNSVFLDPVFDVDGDQKVFPDDDNPFDRSIEEQLAKVWATIIGFPLPERHMLPRVALYDSVVNSQDDGEAKARYLEFLKVTLLDLAQDDLRFEGQNTIEDLHDDIKHLHFSDIAVELGYHKPVDGSIDPIQRLAKLKLPIYITTSYFDFLERAIVDDNRSPRTQVCFWSDTPINVDKAHQTDYDFAPTPESPLVYHLFGLENYPESMVLTEADYLHFLASVCKDTDQARPVLPFYLGQALTQSSLILLGYRLRDWDWRVLFRGIIYTHPSSLRKFNLAIQLDPHGGQNIISADDVVRYLNRYFDDLEFTVEWGTSCDFMDTLWKEWQQWQR